VPLKNPDFAPFLQRVKDDAPDAVFVFVPSGQGAIFMKEFVERGLDKSGIKLIGTGDVTDDDLLADIGDPALGAVTTHHYSAHDSPENKAFVEAFKKTNNGIGRTSWRSAPMTVSGDEGYELDEPARAGVDRSGDARHRAKHLRPQGREEGRRALQRRFCDHPQREGPIRGRQALNVASAATR
jgi:ABC-type branched-subunit amino acid transport system substrate-binding protein